MARLLLFPALALCVSFGFMPSIATAKTVRVKKTKTTTTVVKKKKKKRARKPAPRRRHTGPTLVDRRLAAGTFGLRLGLSSATTFCDCVDEPDVDRISGGLIGIIVGGGAGLIVLLILYMKLIRKKPTRLAKAAI